MNGVSKKQMSEYVTVTVRYAEDVGWRVESRPWDTHV
jgi:hypothetical protein